MLKILLIIAALTSSVSFARTVSVLDNASGVETVCGNDRMPITRLVPWSVTAMRAQAAIFDAIRVVANGKLNYLSTSPLHGMRYLRVIAEENDVTLLPGYNRTVLESTVKAGYLAAQGIAPLQVHEIYNVSDSEGSLSDIAVTWAKQSGNVGIFVENLSNGYPKIVRKDRVWKQSDL
jgi:hypothetical protein